MVRTVLVVSLIALGIGAAVAQQDPIAARQKLMKANGEAAKTGAAMMKGEKPFDAATAHEIFTTFADAAAKMPDLFPDTSKTGGDTTADPKIWDNMSDFKARFQKFGDDAKAAETSVTDLDTFKAAFSGIGKDCGGCHQTYRIKKS